jgi:hypothetical protein
MIAYPIRLSLLLAMALVSCAAVAKDQTENMPPATVTGAPAIVAPAAPLPVPPPAETASVATTIPPAAPSGVRALPPMQYFSSIGGDTVYDLLKADPSFANMDKELAGAPLFLIVTHSIRPTSGGSAAGLFSAILAGSSLGIIPMVTNEEFVVRYEVWLQGRAIATYTFSRTKTRAFNMWSNGGEKNYGLGKEGLDWLKSTAGEFAVKAAHDPALMKLQSEIDYYFPTATAAAK